MPLPTTRARGIEHGNFRFEKNRPSPRDHQHLPRIFLTVTVGRATFFLKKATSPLFPHIATGSRTVQQHYFSSRVERFLTLTFSNPPAQENSNNSYALQTSLGISTAASCNHKHHEGGTCTIREEHYSLVAVY